MPFQSLKDLYVEQLRDLYSAEQQISKAMPELIRNSSSPELRQAFERHLGETKVQVNRLDVIFNKLGEQPGGHHCRGIEGVIQEAMDFVKAGGAPDVADAALIAAAQRIEHYEIAGYGCARTFADRLDDHFAADLLQKTLNEEGAADEMLTGLAEGGINQSASEGHDMRPSRLAYVPASEVSGQARFSEVKVHGAGDEDLGSVDGFVVDRHSGRPYYVVVDSGGWFTGNRYLLPIGSVNFDRNRSRMRASLNKDTIKKYPEFDADAFEWGTERSRQYESRLLETFGERAPRRSIPDWDYERYERIEAFREPEWWVSEGVSVRPRSRLYGNDVNPSSHNIPGQQSRSSRVNEVRGADSHRGHDDVFGAGEGSTTYTPPDEPNRRTENLPPSQPGTRNRKR